jgi:hypothetical protein
MGSEAAPATATRPRKARRLSDGGGFEFVSESKRAAPYGSRWLNVKTSDHTIEPKQVVPALPRVAAA